MKLILSHTLLLSSVALFSSMEFGAAADETGVRLRGTAAVEDKANNRIDSIEGNYQGKGNRHLMDTVMSIDDIYTISLNGYFLYQPDSDTVSSRDEPILDRLALGTALYDTQYNWNMEALWSFEANPNDENKFAIKNGRYGKYINYDGGLTSTKYEDWTKSDINGGTKFCFMREVNGDLRYLSYAQGRIGITSWCIGTTSEFDVEYKQVVAYQLEHSG